MSLGEGQDVLQIRAELARRELARRDYGEYLAYTNGRAWKRTRFGSYLAREVQKFITAQTGNAYDILVIEAPPQHGKSMCITEALPSWCMGRFPDWRIILASYNDETAERFARRNKEKVRGYGKGLFGVEIGRIDRATEFELEGHAGRLISRGILAGITGNPANLLVIDDPIKNRQEADSPTKRQQIWGEWLNSLKSRLAAGAKVVVIMTPWHEDDLAARLLATETNIRLIRLPVAAELDDPLGREEGAPLCPEIGKGRTWLEQFRTSYLSDPEGGPRAWSALYQCAPRVEGGNLVKREWWKLYDPKEIFAFGTEIISVDAAFKGREDNDFVAIEVWAKRGNDYYCRYVLNRHMDFPQTLEAILTVKRLYPRARAVLVEDKANGSAILSVLQRTMFCIGVEPKGGKVARVNAVSAAIESGHVYVPQGAAWACDLIDQFTAFPAGKHDDMVDAATQALSYLLYSSGQAELPAAEEDVVIPAADVSFLDGEQCYDVYGMG
jgi:predicted phage terminase large subunit-like protein